MQLYIIGNGFDRYHGLDTRYQAFGFFLKEEYADIYDYLVRYFGLPDIDRDNEKDQYDPLWSEFEKALADLNFEEVLDEHSDDIANPSDPDFRDRDWHTYEYTMRQIVNDLTDNLFKAFKEFILRVEFPENIDEKRLDLSKTALYLNFNYTDSLETFYFIPKKQILYIHKSANEPDATLILGHGVHPDNFKIEEPKQPEGLSEEELESWRDQMADLHEYSYSSGKSMLMSYFAHSYKETSTIITENASFFKMLNNITNVTILGHSLGEVDKAYLITVIKSVQENAIWTVTYYSDSEKESHRNKLINMGVPEGQIKMAKMDELKLNIGGRLPFED